MTVLAAAAVACGIVAVFFVALLIRDVVDVVTDPRYSTFNVAMAYPLSLVFSICSILLGSIAQGREQKGVRWMVARQAQNAGMAMSVVAALMLVYLLASGL